MTDRPVGDAAGSLPDRRHGGAASTSGGSVMHRRQSGLTQAERATRRHNRRLLLAVAIPSALIGIAALIASILADAGTPTPHPLYVPVGYRAVGDGVFSYAVPAAWSKNTAYSDDTGDLDTSGRDGWAGDHLGARPDPPAAGEAPPQVFQSFGQDRPTPYIVGPAEKITVPGTAIAYRYTISRPDGFKAAAVNAWQTSSGAELWLLVYANPSVTAQVLATLRA